MKEYVDARKTNRVFDTCYLSILFGVIYQFLVFRSIRGLGYAASQLIFWGIIITTVVLYLTLISKYQKCGCYSFIVAIAPLNCYTLISYGFELSRLLFCLSIIVIPLLIICFIIQYTADRDRANNHMLQIHKVSSYFQQMLLILTAFFSLFTVIAGISNHTHGFLNSLTCEQYDSVSSKSQDIEADTLLLIADYNWNQLSDNDKVKVLEKLANDQAGKIGLHHDLIIETKPLYHSVVGSYNDSNHVITIDIEYLTTSDAYDVLCSLFHEVYHAAEHRMCDAFDSLDPQYKDLPCYNVIKCYKEDLTNVMSHSLIMTDFFFHKTELDARVYAEDTADYYYNLLNAIEEPKG